MTQAVQHLKYPDSRQDTFSKTILGFWAYLMTDCIIFATLFTTYGILHNSTFGGATSQDLFSLSTSFAETLILLTSSFACGLAVLAARRTNRNQLLLWLGVIFILGLSFVVIELNEFAEFVREGSSWETSAFLSGFFTLVGTHGLHVSIGLLWLLVLGGQLIYKGVTPTTFRRLACFSLFWHFLDLVWVFIFTFVYLVGVI